MAYNYVTVSGTFPTLTGTVTFTPPQQVTDLTGTVHILGPGAFTCTVSGGSFTSPPLLATDNVGLLPAGWDYTATVALTGQNAYSYPVLIPGANGTTATLSSLPVSASGGGSGEGFNNPMTTLGDMITGGASGAAARLAGNTTAVKQYLTQTGTGSASAAPAWGTIATSDLPSTFLCPPTQYAPGTQASLSTASPSFVAMSSANVNTGQFTVPPSGNVVVTASFAVQVSAGDAVCFGLCPHGGTTPMIGNSVVTRLPNNNLNNFLTIPFIVNGLTAGTAYTLDLMYAVAAAGTVTVNAIGQTATTPVTGATGQGAPVTLTVQGA